MTVRKSFVLNDATHVLKLRQILHGIKKHDLDEALTILQKVEQVNLTSEEIDYLYTRMRISDSMTPTEMNDNLVSGKEFSIVRKSFFHTLLKRKQLRLILEQLVSLFAKCVSHDVLRAILDLVENFSLVCATDEIAVQRYREICFKFFTPDAERTNLIILVVNININSVEKDHMRCFCYYAHSKLNMQFFGCVISTDMLSHRQFKLANIIELKNDSSPLRL